FGRRARLTQSGPCPPAEATTTPDLTGVRRERRKEPSAALVARAAARAPLAEAHRTREAPLKGLPSGPRTRPATASASADFGGGGFPAPLSGGAAGVWRPNRPAPAATSPARRSRVSRDARAASMAFAPSSRLRTRAETTPASARPAAARGAASRRGPAR